MAAAVVGDSQEGEMMGLEQLGAAMGTQFTQTQQAATEATPSGGGRPASPPRTAAARPVAQAFAAMCGLLGVPPHPQIHEHLNALDPDAFAQPTPVRRPGRGGAVVRVPADALPGQVEALLALVAWRLPEGALADSQDAAAAPAATKPEHYLRTVHLDLSGHPLSTQQVQDLLLEAPRRLGQGWMVEGLAMEGCQLGPGTLDLLRSWRAFKPLQQLRRLVLANNPSLGRRAAVPGAAGAAARPSGECLGPADVLWLGKRLLRTALLELLDLRGTVGRLKAVLEALPQLEVVELAGVSPAASGMLLSAWQEVQQQRGAQGCVAQAPGGALRLARIGDPDRVPAEQLPTAHEPLQPPTPEPCFAQQFELPALWGAPPTFADLAAGEVQQQAAPREWQEPPQQRPRLQQQRLPASFAPAQGGRQAAGPRQQQPRRPAEPHQQRAAATRMPGAFFTEHPEQQEGGGPDMLLQADGQRRGPGGCGGGGGGGAPGQGRRVVVVQPRRRRVNGVGGNGDVPLYRGGLKQDDLRERGIDLTDSYDDEEHWQDDDGSSADDDSFVAPDGSEGGEEDEEGSTQEGEASPSGPAPAPRPHPTARPAAVARGRGASGIEGDYFSAEKDDDRATRMYEKLLNKRLRQLREMDPKARKQAEGRKLTWQSALSCWDRRRWINPPINNPDQPDQLDALLQLLEILEDHGLPFPFPPMPDEQREKALAHRALEAAEKLAKLQEEGEEEEAPAARPVRKLRRVGEVEQQALEDNSPPAAAAAATQHPNKRKQVLDDSQESEQAPLEEGDSEGSEQEKEDGAFGGPPRRRPQWDVVALEAAAAQPGGSSGSGSPLDKRQRQPGSGSSGLASPPAQQQQQGPSGDVDMAPAAHPLVQQQQQQGPSGDIELPPAAPAPDLAAAAAAVAAEAEAAAVRSLAAAGTEAAGAGAQQLGMAAPGEQQEEGQQAAAQDDDEEIVVADTEDEQD